MTSTDSLVAIHPIVILSISEYFNRMKTNFNSKRVYGGIIGEISGKKIEISSSFELLDKTYSVDDTDQTKIDLDFDFFNERKRITDQLYPSYDLLGIFSVSKSEIPDQNDIILAKYFIEYGVINPIIVKLSNELLDKDELPLKIYFFSKESNSFINLNFEINGYDSERICLDTVTKAGGVQNNDTQIVQNSETMRCALSMLKSNLLTVLSKIDNEDNQKKFKFIEKLNDVLVNFPNSNDRNINDFLNKSMKDMLILNNIISSSIGISFSSKV